MALDPVLAELLVGPGDLSPLLDRSEETPPVLECTGCHSTYPVVDGIPVMLIDEATPGPQGIGTRS
jgi:uncharacterized protein YbaR (Trm112 family)